MRLLRVHIESAATCGGLLDGLPLAFERSSTPHREFAPICFVGPNGSGKSQLLQILTEAFQSLFAAVVPQEERADGSPELLFEVEYEVLSANGTSERVLFGRTVKDSGRPKLYMKRRGSDEWADVVLDSREAKALVPSWVVGYTSGDNATLSLPFFKSRSEYADDVARQALKEAASDVLVPRTRLMLIDYTTNLEVLIANLASASPQVRTAMLEHAGVEDLHSFRCIIQLAHPRGPKTKGASGLKGVQLTRELQRYIDRLKAIATCWDFASKTRTYTLDFRVDAATHEGFRHLWGDRPLSIYESLHKLAMLNDLMVPRTSRNRLTGAADHRQFASRLPEAHDEEKVFRFESVRFRKAGGQQVDYAALSDGEHQLLQLLGTFAMLQQPNVLFLLDEPESHFNPQWRVHFLSWLLDFRDEALSERSGAHQDCLLTTHAPFVPSDLPRSQVVVFSKSEGRVETRTPRIETYGASFDDILDECFEVRPPIAALSREEISRLLESEDADEVRQGIERLGHSVRKAYLIDHYEQLTESASES